jgi:predicted membrane metal-binding protein
VDRRDPDAGPEAPALGNDRTGTRRMSPIEHAPGPIEQTEEVLSWAGVAAVATIRVVELAAIAVTTLLVVPPLAILVVVVVLPLIVLTALVALVAAVVAVPVFVVRHAHRHRAAHAHHLVRRLADLGRSEQAAATSRVRRIIARAQQKLYSKPTP